MRSVPILSIPSGTEEPLAGPPPANILIVDDRPEDLLTMSSLLSNPDYRIVTAGSGTEALRRVLETDFAVILLDVMMPGMDGFEVASTIKQRERSRYTPILFLTAAPSDAATIYRAYSVGAVDYLVKPLDEAVVRAKVGIFVDLYRKDQRIQEQAHALREADRRERERQLAELRLLSEKRYRSLVEMIPASVWTADAEGVANYYNHHWYESTGLLPEALRAEGWLTAVHPEDSERVRAAWEEARARGEVCAGELRLRQADGGYRWHLCHVIPERDRHERIRGWMGMFADCEELKRAVEVRDEFLSIASHELRTPLSTLMLLLDGIDRTAVSKGLDDKTRRRLQAALRQTERLNSLVDSLLDVARISTGRLELDLEEVDLVEIVQQCVERFAEEASTTGSRIDVVRSFDRGVLGHWDRLRIEQVITNLLSNAIKYGEGKPIEVRLHVDGEKVCLQVIDQGIGINLEHQARIFERFERAVSARHYGGLGMGLYIARQILTAHGGTIAVQSTPGHGATFSITLPVNVKPAAASSGELIGWSALRSSAH